MVKLPLRRSWGYGAAVAGVALATTVRLALDPILGTKHPFVMYYLVVLLSTWACGTGPALLALACGSVAGVYFLLPPSGSPPGSAATVALGLVLYLVVGLVSIAIAASERRARARLEAEVAGRERAERSERELLGRTIAATAKFQAVFNQSGIFAGIMDLEGSLVEVNDLAVEGCGYTREDVLRRPFWEAPWWRGSERVRERVRDAVGRARSGLETREELTYWLADGSERVTEFALHPIRDESGAVRFLHSTGIDVTERTRAERALRTQTARAALLSDILAELLAVNDFGAVARDLFPRVAAQVGADLFVNYLVDAGAAVLRLNGCSGIPDEALAGLRRLEFGAAICGRVAVERRPCHATGIQHSTDSAAALVRGLGVRAYCCYPLIVGDDLLGTLSIGSRTRDRFEPDELEFLGTVAQYVAVAMDRIRSEAALREREDQLRVITNTVPALISYVDADGLYRFVNSRYEEWFGRPRDQIIGRHVEDVLGTAALDAVRPHVDSALRGEPARFETRLDYGGGLVRWVEAKYIPDHGPDGAVRGFFALVLDVTERRDAEARLRESEERFRTLADNISQLAWMADEDGLVFWYNQRWYEYTGTTLEEMRGWGWKAVHHPAHVDRVVARIQHSWDTGEVWEDTFPIRGKDGSYRWFLSHALPIRDGQGRVVRWFGTNTDVTELRALEQALRDQDRRKDEFLAMLAHELRNPLSPIRNAVSVMELAEADPDSQRWARQVIDRQTRHLSSLVDDLLDVSRITQGKITLTRTPLAVSSFVQAAVESSRPLVDARGHRLEVALPDEPLRVDGDLTRLAQVVMNLLNNAAKYTPEGGHIRLAVEREGDQCRLTVRDDGEGIAAEAIPTLFDLFTQASRSPDRSQGGLGVGLTLVRRLVEMHGGTVEARSDGPGKGSEFVVLLPLLRAEPAAETVGARPGPAGPLRHARRVLVVDDSDDSRESLARLLRRLGHEVEAADDGPSALERAAAFIPDLVFLDIGLPGLDGYEVARRLREQPALDGVLIVAYTGYASEADRTRGRAAGFDDHLAKPLELSALHRVLERSQVGRT